MGRFPSSFFSTVAPFLREQLEGERGLNEETFAFSSAIEARA
jgi:hypothetical protein